MVSLYPPTSINEHFFKLNLLCSGLLDGVVTEGYSDWYVSFSSSWISIILLVGLTKDFLLVDSIVSISFANDVLLTISLLANPPNVIDV
jgi:hypothetical protein